MQGSHDFANACNSGPSALGSEQLKVPESAVNDWWKRPFDLLILIAVHIALAPIWAVLWDGYPPGDLAARSRPRVLHPRTPRQEWKDFQSLQIQVDDS